jgi:N6-adenosine-specific RNA methylase IME4
MTEAADANQAYGALTAEFYLAGFTFERAMGRVLDLLKDESWRKVGEGFDDVNEFVRSLRLDQFRALADQRKEFVERVKELQPDVSNRSLAGASGVHHDTVDRDARGGNPPARGRKGNGNRRGGGGNPPRLAEASEDWTRSASNEARSAGEGRRDAARIDQRDKSKERRAEREAKLGAKQLALPRKQAGVLYVDPPWRFEVYSEDTGQGRSAEAHYSTMGVEDIAKIDVPSIAADDCVLFLWATAATLPEAFELLKACGFAYRTHCVWAKDKIGLGFWFRNQHEVLIVAVKGEIPTPAHGTQFPSIIEAPRGEHSAKPDAFYELIESYFPTLPKIELFARKARAGWDCWGDEAPVPGKAAE